jgi:hypothetical protein
LIKARGELDQANRKNDEASRIVLNSIINRLNQLQKELKQIKERTDTYEEAIEEVDKIQQAQSSISGAAAYYQALKDQLEFIANEEKKDDDKKASYNGAVEAKVAEILKNPIVEDNPIEGLKLAEKELLDWQIDANRKDKHAGRKKRSDADIKKEKELNAVIDLLKAKIIIFDNAVNAKIAEKIKIAEGDKKKALQLLLPSTDSMKQYVQSFIWTATTEKTLINKIDKPVEKEAAKRLQLQIKEDALQDPVGAARAQLAAARTFDETISAYNAIIAAHLAKGGISLNKLPSFVQANLREKVTKASKDLIEITNNTRMSDTVKQQKKQEISETTILEVTSLLSPYLVGLSVEAAKTGDPKAIALDIATNKLLNSMLRDQ